MAVTGCGRSARAPVKDADGNTGAAKDADGVVGTGGTHTAGDSGAGGAGGGGLEPAAIDPEKFCGMWQTRASDEETLDLEQYALFNAGTVFDATLGDLVDDGARSYAHLKVGRVRSGIRQYDGLESAIWIDRALYDRFGKGAQVFVATQQPHPLAYESVPLYVWDNPQALLMRTTPVAAELLGFHAWHTPNVAVVRVEQVLNGGIEFALVESLHGNLLSSFLVSLSSPWPSFGMTVGSRWIGGFSELAKTPTGSLPSTSLVELTPDTPNDRASVVLALQTLEPTGFAARYQASLDLANAEALQLQRGWIYHQADTVAALEVTGIGFDCCTNSGGLFHASSLVEVFRGQVPAGQVLTGGLGYYQQKQCGDRVLYAIESPVLLADDLGLDCQRKVGLNTPPTSNVRYEIEASAENLRRARQWVASAPPLLQLHPAGSEIAPAAFAPPAGIALWSTPVSTLAAITAGEPVIFTILSVTERAGGYVVRIRTPFYLYEVGHLEQHEVELGFACADPRLLKTGARWIGILVGIDKVGPILVTDSLQQGRLWLAPGFLLPERSDLLRTLARVVRPAAH